MSSSQEVGVSRHSISKDNLLLPVTTLTIFLSAFLLFSVQPFFTKLVLPKLGGSASVWSVAMVFFQTILLAGYAYAHLLTSRFSLKTALRIHAAVLVTSFLALPIALPAGLAMPVTGGHAPWLFGVFAASVGLPFFAVSANGPLLQAWFAQSGHPHADDPYFLYGASNAGSLLSLFAYVLLIEPFFGLQVQSQLWSAGFAVLTMGIVTTGILAWRKSTTWDTFNGAGLRATVKEPMPDKAGLSAKLAWVGLSFLPSALLVAVTQHISVDIAAAPFVWIFPLSLFLLTFVIAFGKNTPFWEERVSVVLPALIVAVIFLMVSAVYMPISFALLMHAGTFFFAALHCHLKLAKRRPAANQLTQFYFAMSIGGVLGGVFASLVAPVIFNWNAEYFILLLAVFLTLKEFTGSSWKKFFGVSLAVVGSLVGLFLLAQMLSSGEFYKSEKLFFVTSVLILALIGYGGKRHPVIVPALAVALVSHAILNYHVFRKTHVERSFFGVVRVYDNPLLNARFLMHGTTLHGAMRLEDAREGRPLPLTYYTPDGGMGASISAARINNGGTLPLTGLVGVGTGTAACLTKPGERMDLIEIDPLVMKIASDRQHFRFLSECAGQSEVFLGDGRLVVEARPDGTYDHLIVDAYSSDSIPVHLMTTEAIKSFMSKVKPGGMLVLHLSNRHLDLAAVSAENTRVLGYHMVTGFFRPHNSAKTNNLATPSIVAVIVREKEDFGVLLNDPRWQPFSGKPVSAWTDDYSNILEAMWAHYSKD